MRIRTQEKGEQLNVVLKKNICLHTHTQAYICDDLHNLLAVAVFPLSNNWLEEQVLELLIKHGALS